MHPVQALRRACREEQVNDVIGYAFRAGESKIVFDFDDPMGDSTCVACGGATGPTGALMPARDAGTVARQTGRFGVPVRRRLPADVSSQGQPDPPFRARTVRRTQAGCA